MYKWIAAGLACFIVAVLYFTTPSPSTEEVQIGSVLREANLPGLSGPDRTLSSYRGKPLIINVWASWCGPCRDEMRSIQELALRYDGKQFNIIGISTDDYREQAASFLKDSGTTFSQYSDDKRLMETMLGANKIPLTILVDADGKVLDKINGSHDWSSPASIELIRNTFHIEI
jgi:thiol-disulfide isomerase/thioredoxin